MPSIYLLSFSSLENQKFHSTTNTVCRRVSSFLWCSLLWFGVSVSNFHRVSSYMIILFKKRPFARCIDTLSGLVSALSILDMDKKYNYRHYFCDPLIWTRGKCGKGICRKKGESWGWERDQKTSLIMKTNQCQLVRI